MDSGSSFIGLLPLVMAAGLGGILWMAHKGRQHNQAQATNDQQAKIDQAKKFIEAVKASNEFAPVASSRMLQKPGQPVLFASSATLLELKTTTSRGHIGTKVMVGGFPIYVGKSSPMSSTELKESAAGELAVTCKNLVFSGDMKNQSTPVAKITSIETLLDGIKVSAENRAKPVFYKLDNPYLWTFVLQIVSQSTVDGRKLTTPIQVE